jgi:hypothetical protein
MEMTKGRDFPPLLVCHLGPLELIAGGKPVMNGIWRERKMERAQNGAGDGVRTRDPELGKLVLYQLSYTRNPAEVCRF